MLVFRNYLRMQHPMAPPEQDFSPSYISRQRHRATMQPAGSQSPSSARCRIQRRKRRQDLTRQVPETLTLAERGG